jgi:hypothetical protein
MTRKPVVASLVVVALTIMVAAGAAVAPAGTATNRHSSGKDLIGTWVSTIILPAPAPPLRSMSVYHAGGTAVETSSEPPGTRSQMFSTWKRIGNRLYAATGQRVIFNPTTGAFQGTRRINRTIELERDGESLKSVARVTTLDPEGNVVATFTARTSAQRMQLEPIPDLP